MLEAPLDSWYAGQALVQCWENEVRRLRTRTGAQFPILSRARRTSGAFLFSPHDVQIHLPVFQVLYNAGLLYFSKIRFAHFLVDIQMCTALVHILTQTGLISIWYVLIVNIEEHFCTASAKGCPCIIPFNLHKNNLRFPQCYRER